MLRRSYDSVSDFDLHFSRQSRLPLSATKKPGAISINGALRASITVLTEKLFTFGAVH